MKKKKTANRVMSIDMTRIEREIYWLTLFEDAVNDELSIYFPVLAYQVIIAGETGLRWEDVSMFFGWTYRLDINKFVVVQRKTKVPRYITPTTAMNDLQNETELNRQIYINASYSRYYNANIRAQSLIDLWAGEKRLLTHAARHLYFRVLYYGGMTTEQIAIESATSESTVIQYLMREIENRSA